MRRLLEGVRDAHREGLAQRGGLELLHPAGCWEAGGAGGAGGGEVWKREDFEVFFFFFWGCLKQLKLKNTKDR